MATSPSAAPAVLRAYVLRHRHNDDCPMQVVFARNAREARRDGHLDDVEYIDLAALRAPEFDAFAARGWVPVSGYLARGWYWHCDHCGEKVDGEYEEAVVDDAHHAAYCDPDCAARGEGARRGRAFQDAEVEAAGAAALRRWPDAELCYRPVFNHRGYLPWAPGRPHGERAPFPADGYRVQMRLHWRRADGDDVYANYDDGDADHGPVEVYRRERGAR